MSRRNPYNLSNSFMISPEHKYRGKAKPDDSSIALGLCLFIFSTALVLCYLYNAG